MDFRASYGSQTFNTMELYVSLVLRVCHINVIMSSVLYEIKFNVGVCQIIVNLSGIAYEIRCDSLNIKILLFCQV